MAFRFAGGIAGAAMVMTALAVGCSSTKSSGATSNDGGVGADGGAAGAAALSCGGILTCVDACPTADTACSDACVASGSPSAQTKAGALATCIEKNACKDVPCVQAMCAPELTSCVDTSSGGSMLPSGGAPAMGSLPAEIVGDWISSTLEWTFRADGTVSRFNSVTTSGCNSQKLDDGVGVVTGDSLSVYFTSGKLKICGNTSTEPYVAKQEDFTFAIQMGTGPDGQPVQELGLITKQCQYTDAPSANLYCKDTLSRK